jgi:hypothetical protein
VEVCRCRRNSVVAWQAPMGARRFEHAWSLFVLSRTAQRGISGASVPGKVLLLQTMRWCLAVGRCCCRRRGSLTYRGHMHLDVVEHVSDASWGSKRPCDGEMRWARVTRSRCTRPAEAALPTVCGITCGARGGVLGDRHAWMPSPLSTSTPSTTRPSACLARPSIAWPASASTLWAETAMPLPCRRCDASRASHVLESMPKAALEATQVSEQPKRAMSCQRLAAIRLLFEPPSATLPVPSHPPAFCKSLLFSR